MAMAGPTSVVPPVAVVYVLVVLYALCYQLQAPLEPYLVNKLVKGRAAAEAYAELQSFFALVQLIGSFTVGYCIDRVGLRAMFVVSFTASAMSYAILANATSLEVLFFSKLPTIFQAGFLCAQTAAAKMTPAGAERASALGRLTSAYTFGATIGPSLGGVLGTTASACLAVAGSILAICLVMLLPKEVEDTDDKERGSPGEGKPAVALSWPTRLEMIMPKVWPLLLTKLIAGSVNSGNASARPILLMNTFKMEAAQLGMFMSTMYFGSAVIGMQLGQMTTALGGAIATVRFCLCSLGLGYVLLGAPAMFLGQEGLEGFEAMCCFLVTSFAMSLAQFPLATLLTAESTACVSPALKGTLVGMEHAIFSAAGMLAPPLGMLLFQETGLAGLAIVSAAVYYMLYAVWSRGVYIRHAGDSPLRGLGKDADDTSLLIERNEHGARDSRR